MARFTLRKIDEIDGRIAIYMLIKDSVCFYQEFEAQILRDGTYINELDKIQTRLIDISNLKSLPETKFKDITPEKELVKEYEIKTQNLRVYLFKDLKGHIIVLGGKKTNQKKDVKKFRNLKREYLEKK